MSSDGQGSVSPPRDADDNRGVKNKFTGNLKHELRTPLNHIIGYCEMLIEQAQDEGLEVFIADLDRIHSAGKRLLGVIDDLCDPVASRKMDEGMMHHEVRTPLDQVIGYAEMLQEQAEELGRDSFISDFQKVHTAGRHLLNLIIENFPSTQLDSGQTENEVITFTRHQAPSREHPKQGEIVAAPTE